MSALVIILRGCPAGWLGAYGNEWVATPNLDRLAAESVVFDEHISDRPEATTASAAWLGGNRELPVLATLRDVGLQTTLVRANHPDTDGPDWFYAGWGEVFDARPQDNDDTPLHALIRALPTVLDRLASAPDFLLWIEIDRLLPPWDVRQDVFDAYMDDMEETESVSEQHETTEDPADDVEESSDGGDVPLDEPRTPHTQSSLLRDADAIASDSSNTGVQEHIPPWSDPSIGPFDATDLDGHEWLRSTFAAVVTSLDAELGVLFDQLRTRGLDQSAAWVVTSDYGYPLGEHGQIGLYRPWLHEELVHLPLLVRLPGAAEEGRRVAGFTQPDDIAPTLLDLLGVAKNGVGSLLPLTRGEVKSPRLMAMTELELNGAAERSLRTRQWAYLLPTRVPEGESREPMLFEKPDDHCEVNDLRSRNSERADELEQKLKELD